MADLAGGLVLARHGQAAPVAAAAAVGPQDPGQVPVQVHPVEGHQVHTLHLKLGERLLQGGAKLRRGGLWRHLLKLQMALCLQSNLEHQQSAKKAGLKKHSSPFFRTELFRSKRVWSPLSNGKRPVTCSCLSC